MFRSKLQKPSLFRIFTFDFYLFFELHSVFTVRFSGLKDDVLPEMLSSLKSSLPKANGYYHPLAISFPGY